jgi:kumamolisin
LAPSQVNSIYGAPHVGSAGQGAGVKIALYELSAYQQSDVDTWAQTFYGNSYVPPLTDVTVDGGPVNPNCPPGDTCPPYANGYSGDVEVDLDIEMALALAPAAADILVYMAPADYTGQTTLDNYSQIANDDIGDVVSSSWGLCENDAGSAYAQAENVIFEQMALQGQSMFAASGDNGAFDCVTSDGTTIVDLNDPAAQPWVTSAGGTSLGSDNPRTRANPGYPKDGFETVWNPDGLCNTSSDEGGQSGYFWCSSTGAGGGGSSQFWGLPFYQIGPGVTSSYSTFGNGTTQCALAAIGAPCREGPDVSANADEFTGYAVYCTGNVNTPYSGCATFDQYETPFGWTGVGGTSAAAPLWASIFADRDGFQGSRSGNANPILYELFNLDEKRYFHDITGVGQIVNNNGLFPTTPGYDLATGIGTPKMSPLIIGK